MATAATSRLTACSWGACAGRMRTSRCASRRTRSPRLRRRAGEYSSSIGTSVRASCVSSSTGSVSYAWPTPSSRPVSHSDVIREKIKDAQAKKDEANKKKPKRKNPEPEEEKADKSAEIWIEPVGLDRNKNRIWSLDSELSIPLRN